MAASINIQYCVQCSCEVLQLFIMYGWILDNQSLYNKNNTSIHVLSH